MRAPIACSYMYINEEVELNMEYNTHITMEKVHQNEEILKDRKSEVNTHSLTDIIVARVSSRVQS